MTKMWETPVGKLNTHGIFIDQSLMRQKPLIHFQDIFMLFLRILKATCKYISTLLMIVILCIHNNYNT